MNDNVVEGSANRASASVTEGVDLSFLDDPLAADLGRSLEKGLAMGAVFAQTGGPDDQFRASLTGAIRVIESNERAALLRRFLAVGPYVDSGEIPRARRGDFLTDEEVAATIRFIHSSAISSFQGALAELLAVEPVCEVARREFAQHRPVVFVGDAVQAFKPRRSEWAKAADFHLLDVLGKGPGAVAEVRGVGEVKSYLTTPEKLRGQLAQHLRRAQRGLRVGGTEIPAGRIRSGRGDDAPIEIVVVPSDWTLSRAIRFESDGDRSFLAQAPCVPPQAGDSIEKTGPGRWLIKLRWSKEALASVAYEMTFWYLGTLGQSLSDAEIPPEWSGMTRAEVGQNAAKMMLYYAMLRARSVRETSRAIALYNAYGFGYALGANFIDAKGRRCELFFEDLREIAATGRSRTVPIDVKDDDGRVTRVIPPQNCRLQGAKRRNHNN